MSVRVQPLKNTVEHVQNLLNKEGIETKHSELSQQGLNIIKGNPLNSKLFPKEITIQDETSMLVSEMLDVEPGMKVLDACSAPGGKTTHIAEKMNNEGTVIAYDLHDKKVKLVKDKAETLDLDIIHTSAQDSRMLNEIHQEESFDRIY